MALTKDGIVDALRRVNDPELHRDIVSLGAVRQASICDGHAMVRLSVSTRDPAARERMKRDAETAIRAAAIAAGERLKQVDIDFADAAAGRPPAPDGGAPAKPRQPGGALPGVRHIIAVGAGKGGVGKSTIALNLAAALSRAGHAVGLLDGDIYGPSVPTLLGLDQFEQQVVGNMLQPFYVHGVKAVTIGKLIDPDKPLIWRGPMAHGAFSQLVNQTQWGELDYLIIDLPPGTGDVPLTMAQLLSLTGAVIVCTPQKVAQDDAVRAAKMFQQLGIAVLGVVENMSYFVGDDGKEYDLFGRGGAEQMAQRLGVPYLGGVPISMALRRNSDEGDPSANFSAEAGNARLKAALEEVARQVGAQAALASTRAGIPAGGARPELTIS